MTRPSIKSEPINKALTIMARVKSRLSSGYANTSKVEVTYKDDRLKLRAVNSNVGLYYAGKASSNVPVEEPPVVTLPTKTLQIAVDNKPFDIELERTETESEVERSQWNSEKQKSETYTETVTTIEGKVTVTDADGCKIETPILDCDMFETKDIEVLNTVCVSDLPDFLTRLEYVLTAVAPGDERPHLACVCCDPEAGFVATDGHRLHMSDAGVCPEEQLLLNREGVERLVDVLRLHKGSKNNPPPPFTLCWGKLGLAVIIRSWVVTIPATQDTRFPPFNKVIRRWEDSPIQVEPDRDMVIKALKKVEKTGCTRVAITLSDGELCFSADTPETDLTVKIPAAVQLDETLWLKKRFGMSARYFTEALAAPGKIYIADPEESFVFKHALGLAVVMPARL